MALKVVPVSQLQILAPAPRYRRTPLVHGDWRTWEAEVTLQHDSETIVTPCVAAGTLIGCLNGTRGTRGGAAAVQVYQSWNQARQAQGNQARQAQGNQACQTQRT